MEQYIGNLNYLFQFCGFSSFSKSKPIQTLLIIPTFFWFIFPTLCVLLGHFVFPVIVSPIYDVSPPMTLYLNMLNYTMRFLSHTICVFEAWWKKDCEGEIISDIAKVDKILFNYFNINVKKNYQNAVKIIIYLYVVVLLIFSILLYLYCSIQNFWFISLTTYIMLFIFDLQIIVYVIVILDRIKLLRECLQVYGVNKSALNVLTDAYLQLYDLNEGISSRFKVSFLVRLYVLYLQFTCAVYWLLEVRIVVAFAQLLYCK